MEVILKQKPCFCFSRTFHFNGPFHSERLQLHLCSIKNLWLIYLMGFSLSSLPWELGQLECISIRGSVERRPKREELESQPLSRIRNHSRCPLKRGQNFCFHASQLSFLWEKCWRDDPGDLLKRSNGFGDDFLRFVCDFVLQFFAMSVIFLVI